MSVTSRRLYRWAYRSSALISLAILKTVRSRQGWLGNCRQRGSLQNSRKPRTMRNVMCIDRKKIKEIALKMGRYSGRYTGGTPGRLA